MRWRMKAIGPGPGPKNVWAVHDDGRQVCVPYAIWKHRLSKEIALSDVKKPWASAVGEVQAFMDKTTGVRKPAVTQGNANGQPVWNLTIKTFTTGAFVDVALWGEYAHVAPQIQEGFVMFVSGPVEQREYNGQIYNKVNAKKLTVLPCVTPIEREVVNQAPAATVAAAPVAAAPVAAAPVAAPVAVAEAAPAAAAAPFTF